MKKKSYPIFVFIMFVGVQMGLQGCTSNRCNLIKNSEIEIKQVSSVSHGFSNISVTQKNEVLEIQGHINRFSMADSGIGGHVDIAFMDKRGSVISCISTEYRPAFIASKRRHSRHSHFQVNIPMVLAPGSKVFFAFHKTTSSDSHTFDCGNNAAKPM